MTVKYAYTILYVQDVEKTLEFYKQAFLFEVKFVTPEKDYGELISGATVIAFANIEVTQAVEKGAEILEPVVQKPWGQKVGYLRDINGFIIEICSPMPSA